MSSVSSVVGDGPPRRMVAEVPLPMAPRKKTKQKNPQEKLDEFWNKFTTKAPGKGELTPIGF